MKRSILLVTLFFTIIPGSFTQAQTTNPGVNQLIKDANISIEEAEADIRRNEAAGRQYQSYLDRLFQACMNGNQKACNEYDRRLKRQNRRLDTIIQQTNPNNPQNRRWAESFCHPYCN
mgnify:CR=1 FL=1